jgi:ATP-dependent Clp protease protease subunit
MTTPPLPEIPFPLPPERWTPRRAEPLQIPTVYEQTDPVARLYERRVIMVGGPLDAAATTCIAAELMHLDGGSDRPIELLVNSPGGPVGDVFAVLDVMSLLRAPLGATCFGQALGTAAVVVACAGGKRQATANATFSLRCPPAEASTGTAHDLQQQAALDELVRGRLRAALRAATRIDADRIGHELGDGAPFDAIRALELGVIDEIRRETLR